MSATAAAAVGSISNKRRNVFGTMTFCPECGNLLESPGEMSTILCNVCGESQEASQYENIEVVTRTNPNAFPSALKNKRSLVVGNEDNEEKRAQHSIIDENCPKCDSKVMEFYTMQLRSADEGQTVFFNCPKCGYKYSQNN